MRITFAHHRTREQAVKAVNDAAAQLRPDMGGPVKVSEVNKSWNGSRLDFSLTARLGPVASPIHGWVEVTDRDITIDCDLPALLTSLIPERTLKSAVESRVRGLLH